LYNDRKSIYSKIRPIPTPRPNNTPFPMLKILNTKRILVGEYLIAENDLVLDICIRSPRLISTSSARTLQERSHSVMSPPGSVNSPRTAGGKDTTSKANNDNNNSANEQANASVHDMTFADAKQEDIDAYNLMKSLALSEKKFVKEENLEHELWKLKNTSQKKIGVELDVKSVKFMRQLIESDAFNTVDEHGMEYEDFVSSSTRTEKAARHCKLIHKELHSYNYLY